MRDVAKHHSRTGLYLPFIIVLIVVAVWSGWWFYLAQQVQQRLDLQAAALRQAGWTIAYTHGGIGGWPFRTRLETDHVSITAPSGHALAAPKLVLQANAWNPDKWMLLATDGLTLTRADKGRVAVRAPAIRASVHGLTQRWPNVAIELAEPVFTALPGGELFPISRAKSIQFYLRPHIGPANAPDGSLAAANSVDVLFRLIDAEGRAGGPVEGMAQNGKLTAQIETVIEKADTLAGPDTAGVFAAWTRAGGRFVRVRGEMSAGESRATLSSDVLSGQADGRLQGRLTLKAVKPLPAIAGLARSGSGGVNQAGAAGAAAASAVTGGGGDDVDLVLVFRDGRTFLGPFALAPAPKLF